MSARAPHFSVVIATYRPLGAVVPLRALAYQSHRDFEVVVVTEIGPEAYGGVRSDFEELTEQFPCRIVGISNLPYHAPTAALNHGIDAARGKVVALLADFAWPHRDWLLGYSRLDWERCSIVGGTKCPHGKAPPWTCGVPPGGDRACEGNTLLPIGIAAAPVDCPNVYPFQGAINLGNVAFLRDDAKVIDGLDERFAGGHGCEDDNFVRRMVGSTRKPAAMMKSAVVHHFWPYASGFKPVLSPSARPWANGHSNVALDLLIADAETLMGNHQAQRVVLPSIVAPESLVQRAVTNAYDDHSGGPTP